MTPAVVAAPVVNQRLRKLLRCRSVALAIALAVTEGACPRFCVDDDALCLAVPPREQKLVLIGGRPRKQVSNESHVIDGKAFVMS